MSIITKIAKSEIINKYFYFKLCLNRSANHLGFFTDFISKIALISIFLKTFKIFSIPIITTISIATLTTLIYIGHMDIKHKVINRETSFNNRYNPEIQKLLKK